LTSLRFLEGAIKQTFEFGDFNGATEFRDSVYVSAPSNRFVASLASVDLQSDSFFTGTPDPESLSTSVTCGTTPDIEVEVSMESEQVQAITARCESERFSGDINFCGSTELEQAQSRYNSVCTVR
jgi:hypothetical protein